MIEEDITMIEKQENNKDFGRCGNKLNQRECLWLSFINEYIMDGVFGKA